MVNFGQNNKRKRITFGILTAFILLAIGGTIAYYAEQLSFDNKFQLSAEEIEHTEEFTSPKNWEPCEETPKTLVTTNNSNHNIKVRLKYDEWWRNQADTENLPLEQDGSRLTTINFQNEDDWELSGEWYYWKGELAPGESTRSLFKSVTFNCSANFAVQHICTDQGCEDIHSPYEGSDYHIFITVQTTDEEFPRDEDMRTVTVDPNGGVYKGSNQAKSYDVMKGRSYTLEDATRDTYAFDHWEYVGGDHDGEVLSSNIIEDIQENITIKATWLPAVARIERTGKLYTSIMKAEAEAQNGDIITLLINTAETVTNEKTVTLDLGAHTVTGSLTNTASGDLTLINGEINNPGGIAVTNNGTLTMGVDDFKDDGKVNIDNSYVRLIGTTTGIKQNGVFNFYDGFLEGDIGLEGGYNKAPEYRNTFDGTIVHYFPLVDHISNTERQHVELANADLAVSKTTVNGDIYYYNIQDNINTSAKTGYQIYAVRDFTASYPLVVKENESIVFDIDGWDVVFADTFTNNGTIQVTNSKNEGKISASQTIVNNSELIIKDAEITGTSSFDTITNNATLKLRNSTISASGTGYVLQPISGTMLDMDDDSYVRTYSTSKAAIRNSTNDFVINGGHVAAPYIGIENTSGSSLTMANNAAVETTQIPRTGAAYGVSCGGNSTITLKNNSSITARSNPELGPDTNPYDTSNIVAINADSTCQVYLEDDATIYAKSIGNAKGIEHGSITLKGNSTLSADGVLWVYASYQSSSVTIGENTTATITATSQNGTTAGIYQSNVNIKSGAVTATKVNNTGGDVAAVNCSARWAFDTTCNISGGTITATNNGSDGAWAIANYSDEYSGTNTNISGGTMTATANTGAAYGFANSTNKYNGSVIRIEGGTFTAISTAGTGFGANINTTQNYITGGTITGSTYGIYGNARTINLGEDEGGQPSITSPEIVGGEYGIYSGAYNFYDGIIRGGENAYQTDVIKKIPDATIYHTEREPGEGQDDTTPQDERTGRENCWLVDAENYLEVDGVGYNSLTKAYNAITGDSGTIKVIANAQIEAALPISPADKDVTFDLNGHELIYMQSLTVGGPMTILDSSAEQTGKLSNPNTYTITNNGTLNIQSGLFSSSEKTIKNTGTLNMSGGKVVAPYLSIENTSNSSLTMSGNASIETTQVPRTGTVYGVSCGENCSINMKDTSKIYVRSNPDSPADPSEWDTSTGEAISATSSSKITLENNASIISENKGYAYGIERGTVTLKDNATIRAEGTWRTYALFDTDTVNIGENTTASIIANSASREASAVYRSSAIIRSGTISASTNSGDGASALNCSARWQHDAYCEIYGGTMTATNTGSGPAYASAGYSEEYNGTNIKFYGGTMTATANTGAAYGFANSTNKYNGSVIRIEGGTFTAISTAGTGFGANINTTQNYITGGTITGSTYGIYGNARTINLGEDEGGQPSITSPEIVGGEYGIYSGAYNFYDGIIKGKLDPYENPDIINTIVDGYTIKYDTDTIDGETYQTSYLISEYDVAKIGSTNYTSLQDAINAAVANDTIELIANNYIFTDILIPSDKEITIDLAGFNIVASHPFTNAGKTLITNSSATSPTLNYRFSQYYITNAADAELELNGIDINSVNGVDNAGTLKITNTSITATKTGIKNTNFLTINTTTITTQDTAITNTGTIRDTATNQSSLTGKNYALYTNGGDIELNNTTLTANTAYYQNTNAVASFADDSLDGRISINSGTTTFADSTFTETGVKLTRLLMNSGDTAIINSTFTLTSENMNYWGGEEEMTNVVSNSNSLTLTNVDIDVVGTGYIDKNVYGIYNTGSQLIATDVDIASSFSNLTGGGGTFLGIYNGTGTLDYKSGTITGNFYNMYGIHNESGTLNYDSGTITATANTTSTGIYNNSGAVNILSATINANATTAYGVNNNTGEITLGEPEPSDSEDWGKATAHVSIINPSIRAIGTTTGYGVKNGASGRINYYDGIITASTHPMPEIPAVPTKAEYLYEPKIHTDGDGYQYMILEWMREQPGN